eukprot:5891314-Amphidinium_carterae.3
MMRGTPSFKSEVCCLAQIRFARRACGYEPRHVPTALASGHNKDFSIKGYSHGEWIHWINTPKSLCGCNSCADTQQLHHSQHSAAESHNALQRPTSWTLLRRVTSKQMLARQCHSAKRDCYCNYDHLSTSTLHLTSPRPRITGVVIGWDDALRRFVLCRY